MYQEYHDIFDKLMKYLFIARELKDDINEVHVYNSIEVVFGKKYCRVYVDFKLKDGSSKAFELQELRYKNFNNVGLSDYFSFYLGYDDYETKEDRLKNKEEQIHYYYIWNFLAWQLRRDGITVRADYFISQYYEKIKWKEENEKREKENRKILREISQYLNQEEDRLFVVKKYDKIKIGKFVKLGTYNSLILFEIKKDLTIGKVKIDVSTYDTFAIIKPSLLNKSIIKEELLELINENNAFNALIWKKE